MESNADAADTGGTTQRDGTWDTIQRTKATETNQELFKQHEKYTQHFS